MRKLLFLLLIMPPLLLGAQVDSTAPEVTVGAYVEPYYGYDFNQPANGNRPGFVYAYHRHNEFNLNIGYIKASISAARFHGNFALMAGTYANANLAAEPETLKNLYEANAGVKISKKHELWIDGGVFGSHIGFESAVGKDCWTLTRSMLADNSPYYESGAKLSYTAPNGKWFLIALALNGWQRIQRVPGNSLISGGTQIQFKPNSKVTLNSSSFFGTDQPDDTRLWRFFHNFYGIFQLSDRFGVILGLDTGWQENPKEEADPNVWFSPVLISRYAFNDRLTLAARVEYYNDENGVIIDTGLRNGFQTLGVSVNLDVQVHKNAVWRIEGKIFKSQEAIFFDTDGTSTHSNAVVTTALAIWL